MALGLDLLIRQETAGARSLDDVMRLLWQRHGRDFTRAGHKAWRKTACPR